MFTRVTYTMCLLRRFTGWFIHTHQTVILERQTCHTRFKVWSLTWGWFTHWNMNSSLHWGGFKENSLLKQIHCMQPLAQWSNSPIIMVALSPTDMFTYRHTNIHAHSHAQGKLTNWQDILPFTSPLWAAQWLQTPMCEACVSLSLISVSLSLTHFSTCSHRVALVTLYCSELRQRENGAGREG